MADRDGNGWIRCAQGHRHWGRYGAAGLLARALDSGSRDLVLLQRRSRWVSHGGTWGPPGGAMDSHESPVTAALREAAEECGVPARSVVVRAVLADDHGGWAFHTVLAEADQPFPVRSASAEASEVAWVPLPEVDRLALHPGFAAQWPVLTEALLPLTVIVDAANVMGSRPDGWWRDRAGAATRLGRELSALAAAGVRTLPDTVPAPVAERWYPRFVLVLEGAARRAADALAGYSQAAPADLARPDPVRVVAAEGSGDDAIARLSGQPDGRRLVVTADRELRRRCQAAGASVTGPRWLLDLLRADPVARPT